jgi:hypothetical protein
VAVLYVALVVLVLEGMVEFELPPGPSSTPSPSSSPSSPLSSGGLVVEPEPVRLDEPELPELLDPELEPEPDDERPPDELEEDNEDELPPPPARGSRTEREFAFIAGCNSAVRLVERSERERRVDVSFIFVAVDEKISCEI